MLKFRRFTNFFLEDVSAQVNDRDYTEAAKSFVKGHIQEKELPQNAWKWWKRKFGSRPDYIDLTQKIVKAVLEEFDSHGEIFRETIAKMFRKNRSAAEFPANRFLAAVRRRNTLRLPLPESISSAAPLLSPVTRKYHYPRFPIRTDGPPVVDLRKDAQALKKLLVKLINFHIRRTAKLRSTRPVSAIAAGFYLIQSGWVVIHFDTRPHHKRDGDWTTFIDKELVCIPAWKNVHDTAHKYGATFILPDGKRSKVAPRVACRRLSAIYGTMIQTVLLDARKTGKFKKLPKTETCQIDIEEFDGKWAWPRFSELGKTNLV